MNSSVKGCGRRYKVDHFTEPNGTPPTIQVGKRASPLRRRRVYYQGMPTIISGSAESFFETDWLDQTLERLSWG